MTLDTFRLRYPEFRAVPDVTIKDALARALAQLDTQKVWNDPAVADEGQGALACHFLSVAYEDPQDPNTKNYLDEFNRLKRTVTSGFRVA